MISLFNREWLRANGLGTFACGTVSGANTRRYHALLCVSTTPPTGRVVLVNKVEETLLLGNARIELGQNFYSDATHPDGARYLQEFESDPLPRWVYEVPVEGDSQGVVRLEKLLWMPYGRQEVRLRYTLLDAPEALTLQVRPFLTGRDYHATHRYNASIDTSVEGDVTELGDAFLRVQPYPHLPSVEFHGGEFREELLWFYNLHYEREAERGLDHQEDAWSPGTWNWTLAPGEAIEWTMRADVPLEGMGKLRDHGEESREAARARRATLADAMRNVSDESRESAEKLTVAADAFLVRRARDAGWTILAGYPWFTDWGRDTMIALPGLCLSTGRFYEAASILLGFSRFVSEGMIPNRFPDEGEAPDTNTVDATLWFFHACREYERVSGDGKTVSVALYPVLKEIVAKHIEGTRYNIRADWVDGCLRAGSPETQLTWMDAKVGDVAFTPRNGKPVEIQALWFNALTYLESLAVRKGDDETRTLCHAGSSKLRESFRDLFWNSSEQCLADVVLDDGSRDDALRPNQVFAVSLPDSLLSPDDERAVVSAVQRDLLTPYGLRSLSPRDSRYIGTYGGPQYQRDGAYHQGTVWAWLIGPFLDAYLKVNGDNETSRAQVRAWLQPLISHLDDGCVGQIAEIFDGDAPHAPRGCFAQAWSVAEVLRLWLRAAD